MKLKDHIMNAIIVILLGIWIVSISNKININTSWCVYGILFIMDVIFLSYMLNWAKLIRLQIQYFMLSKATKNDKKSDGRIGTTQQDVDKLLSKLAKRKKIKETTWKS